MPDLDESFAIGLDLGGTNARAAAVDADGHLLAVEKRQLQDRSPEAAADALAECTAAALAACGRDESLLQGVAVGIAGQIDARSGRVIVAPNLGWRDVDIGGLISQRIQRPVRVANDLSVAALGEARAGAAKGHDDVVLVFVGSGIGSGLILNGRIFEGARGVAAEFGHVKVRPNGRLCGCGEHGCLEAYAGGHNLGIRAAEAVRDGAESLLSRNIDAGERITARSVEDAARQGDNLSLELMDEAAKLIGVATANVVTLLNPAVLILGGGVLLGWPELRERIEKGVREHASRASAAELLIAHPALGDDAGVIGAAFLARE